jgi:lysozyme family protein
MMANYSALIARNAARWAAAKLTRGPEFNPVAKRLVAGKPRYQAVEAKTGVPWFIIAVIHEREASQKWNANLAQGDPWNRVSTHVPRGRGPFNSWDEAAVDALVNCAPYASKWKDWTPGGAMTLLELYNGLGYANKGRPSPYVWAGTDQYASGKYIADGVYDPNAIDKQLGCAGLILAMMSIDTSVRIDLKPPVSVPQPAPSPAPLPIPPAPQSWVAGLVAAVLSFFKSKV